jgi:hypothetical protein
LCQNGGLSVLSSVGETGLVGDDSHVDIGQKFSGEKEV